MKTRSLPPSRSPLPLCSSNRVPGRLFISPSGSRVGFNSPWLMSHFSVFFQKQSMLLSHFGAVASFPRPPPPFRLMRPQLVSSPSPRGIDSPVRFLNHCCMTPPSPCLFFLQFVRTIWAICHPFCPLAHFFIGDGALLFFSSSSWGETPLFPFLSLFLYDGVPRFTPVDPHCQLF